MPGRMKEGRINVAHDPIVDEQHVCHSRASKGVQRYQARGVTCEGRHSWGAVPLQRQIGRGVGTLRRSNASLALRGAGPTRHAASITATCPAPSHRSMPDGRYRLSRRLKASGSPLAVVIA
jgi:hypothetical protein